MKCLDLFSGIGGIALGFEAAGIETVAFCEREAAPRHWLAQHWPDIPIYEDVRELTGQIVTMDCGPIDIIAGGFPCQPFSVAGKQKGTEDERHLWPHFARLIREIRPRWVLAENVPGLRTIAADLVLGDLEESGYSAWPLVVGADDVGAPHRRKRVWIVARKRLADTESGVQRADWRASRDAGHPDRGGPLVGESAGERLEGLGIDAGEPQEPEPRHASPLRWPARPGEPQHAWEAPRLAHAHSTRRAKAGGGYPLDAGREPEPGRGAGMADSPREPTRSPGLPRQEPDPGIAKSGMGDSVDGLPGRVAGLTSAHRREALKALGNSVVSPLVAAIGRAIMRMEHGAL